MNSFISHRLYAAAVASAHNSPARPARNETASARVAGIASAIPLELMEAGKPLPPTAARRLRTSPVPHRS